MAFCNPSKVINPSSDHIFVKSTTALPFHAYRESYKGPNFLELAMRTFIVNFSLNRSNSTG